jgi:predicted hotdog family 3-hydroxylacyl-ACP dehydratase
MLLGTRRYQARTAWFVEGARLVIHAECEFGGEGGLAACHCRIEANGDIAAEAKFVIIEEDAE